MDNSMMLKNAFCHLLKIMAKSNADRCNTQISWDN